MVKVQCISNSCGFFDKLKRGNLYFVEDYSPELYIVYENEHILAIIIYDKKMFRTLSERRDIIISKILTTNK
jgi:hypothetical protein